MGKHVSSRCTHVMQIGISYATRRPQKQYVVSMTLNHSIDNQKRRRQSRITYTSEFQKKKLIFSMTTAARFLSNRGPEESSLLTGFNHWTQSK
jgi:hypothetical protein